MLGEPTSVDVEGILKVLREENSKADFKKMTNITIAKDKKTKETVTDILQIMYTGKVAVEKLKIYFEQT